MCLLSQAACCGPDVLGRSSCVMGLPKSCTTSCAAVLLPVQQSCEADGAYLALTSGTDLEYLRSTIDAVATLCTSSQPLACEGEPPSCMPCVGDVIYQYTATCSDDTAEWLCRESSGCSGNGCIGRRIDGLGEPCPADSCIGYPPPECECVGGEWQQCQNVFGVRQCTPYIGGGGH